MPNELARRAGPPAPPYYAVIFTSVRRPHDDGYDAMAAHMVELAREQPGFLGIDSVRDGAAGITISYWRDLRAIAAWKTHMEHQAAQALGKARWYEGYVVHIARVERAYGFGP